MNIYSKKRETYLETVKEMVNSGADLNEANKMGETPLWLSITRGYSEIADYLLEKGADPYLKVKKITPIEILFTMMFHLFVKYFDKWKFEEELAISLVNHSIENNDIEKYRFLFSKPEFRHPPNKPGRDGKTHLLAAIELGDLKFIYLLLEEEPDVFSGDNKEYIMKLQERALARQNLKVIKLLYKFGAPFQSVKWRYDKVVTIDRYLHLEIAYREGISKALSFRKKILWDKLANPRNRASLDNKLELSSLFQKTNIVLKQQRTATKNYKKIQRATTFW